MTDGDDRRLEHKLELELLQQLPTRVVPGHRPTADRPVLFVVPHLRCYLQLLCVRWWLDSAVIDGPG